MSFSNRNPNPNLNRNRIILAARTSAGTLFPVSPFRKTQGASELALPQDDRRVVCPLADALHGGIEMAHRITTRARASSHYHGGAAPNPQSLPPRSHRFGKLRSGERGYHSTFALSHLPSLTRWLRRFGIKIRIMITIKKQPTTNHPQPPPPGLTTEVTTQPLN